jgi:hypothetical protein
MSTTSWVAGSEHEPKVLASLGTALRGLGYDLRDSWEGVGGSQDIAHWEVVGPRGSLTIECETYIGVTVEGPIALVAELRSAIKQADGHRD